MLAGLCGACWPQWARRQPKACDERDPVQGCPFCAVAAGAEPDRVLYQDSRLIVMPDRSPRAATHLLVIPRAHVANTNCMGPGDLDLAEELERVGREVLSRHCAPGAPMRFGYHVPPWRSVDHLHLHCLAPPFTPPLAALKYSVPGVWLPSRELIARLRGAGGKRAWGAGARV
ncbi:hypothetical protein HYH03_010496 [Edaphochlamys debaryana]|uniref:HIT domain-containing protein n=1 Tax=Edaphochlamys debaryana TaxID=47281 RepID=A0A836BW39_9CHLO|nr:hypothetical protein HYH03_010496 [Edaphochlamys debaryana]|eukprot:KAG2491050.1 hypothetical protein HYH03_010496 [Edaphochlamys debaryana]